jgi:hypothetical protein
MPVTPASDLGEAFFTSLGAALSLFVIAIPKILGFLVILLVGWFVASLLARLVARLLRGVRFDEFAGRTGLRDFVGNMGVRMDASTFVANLTKWFVRLVTIVVAFDVLGLPAVSQVLQQLLAFLPQVVVALVVLALGGLAANALSRIVRGATAEAGLGDPNLLANLAAFAIWAFAIVVAVNQLGIASNLVTILFAGLVGMLALALGLSFGLGGREVAGRIVSDWYTRTREAAPKVARAAEAAREAARDERAERGPERIRVPSAEETQRLEQRSGDGKPTRRM